jgi:hypothetical protein
MVPVTAIVNVLSDSVFMVFVGAPTLHGAANLLNDFEGIAHEAWPFHRSHSLALPRP